MPIKAGFKYKDMKIPCEYCDRKFKTPQGYSGHLLKVHGLSYEKKTAIPSPPLLSGDRGLAPALSTRPERDPVPPIGDSTVADLENELKALELRAKIERLKSPQRQQPDVAEGLGLGKLSPEISASLQSRAFAMAPPPPDPLSSLINSPNFPAVVELIKSIVNRPVPAVAQSNGSNGLGILKDLGIDLMSLITQRQASPGLKIGQLDLSGMPLDAAAVGSLIESQAAIAASEGQKAMVMEGLQVAGKYAPMVGKLLQGVSRPIDQDPASMQDPAPMMGTLVACGTCGANLKIKGQHGDQITCEGCGSVWDIDLGEGVRSGIES